MAHQHARSDEQQYTRQANPSANAQRSAHGVVQTQNVTVTCDSSAALGQDSADIEKRVMSVRAPGREQPFSCVHYQMVAWPDHGAPELTLPLQEMIVAANEVRPPPQAQQCQSC